MLCFFCSQSAEEAVKLANEIGVGKGGTGAALSASLAHHLLRAVQGTL